MKDYARYRLNQILRERKDARYRQGVVDMARAANVISQDEWVMLTRMVKYKDRAPQVTETPNKYSR
jgi:hypothetical protein